MGFWKPQIRRWNLSLFRNIAHPGSMIHRSSKVYIPKKLRFITQENGIIEALHFFCRFLFLLCKSWKLSLVCWFDWFGVFGGSPLADGDSLPICYYSAMYLKLSEWVKLQKWNSKSENKNGFPSLFPFIHETPILVSRKVIVFNSSFLRRGHSSDRLASPLSPPMMSPSSSPEPSHGCDLEF